MRRVLNQTDRLNTALADRYRILRHLGEGGMASVYLAEDLKHGRKVAIKVLREDLSASQRVGSWRRSRPRGPTRTSPPNWWPKARPRSATRSPCTNSSSVA